MILFGGELGVVEVQLVDYCVDVECGLDGIELEGCVGYFCIVWYDCVGYDGVEQFGVGRVGQCFEFVFECVDQVMMCCFQCECVVDIGVQYVVDDIDEYCIWSRVDVGDWGGY